MRIGLSRVVVPGLAVLLALFSLAQAGEAEFTANVPGTDVIFLSGRTGVVIPALGSYDPAFPLLRHGYVLGDFVKETFPRPIAAKGGMVFTFSATGAVHYYNGPGYGSGFGPDGSMAGISTLSSLAGISGYRGPQGALVGVFLNEADPAQATPPAALDFWPGGIGTSFTSLSPALGQVFFIGDGSTPDGLHQTFIAPAGATRLFLGIPDGFGFVGGPGAYEDNDGSFSVQASYALPDCGASGIVDQACVYDDFNDNALNGSLWSAGISGTGPASAEANKRLEMDFPASSTGSSFGASLVSACRLRGDFDIQADFSLLLWPPSSGVRVALSAAAGPTERVSFGSYWQDFPGQPREVYLTHFSDGVQGIVATADLSGTFRMVRAGTMVTGYHYADGAWVAIHTGPATADDAAFSVAAWSHDYTFTGQDVKLAFDNVIINKGQLICNNADPVAAAGPDQTVECSGPSGATVTLDGSGSSDPDGDALTYTWTWNGGSATGVHPVVTLPFGVTTVALTVEDGRGGKAADTVVITVQDTMAPTTTAIVSGTAGQNGWYVSDVTVSLNAVDSCSGVKEIHYTINGAETVVGGNAANFTLSADGSYTVIYWAVDNSGQGGGHITVPVDREASPPVTTPVVPAPPADGNGYYRSCVPVTLTSVAGSSGLAATEFSIDGGATWHVSTGEFTVCGTTTITYRAMSNAGNAEQPKTLVINIDTTPPTITATATPLPNAYGWNSSLVTVHFTCNDALSGIASCPADITVSTEGAGQPVNGTAVDRAGNTASTSVTLNIDLTAPAITIVGVADGASYPLCSLPTPSSTVADNLSGVISQSALLTPPSNASGAGLYTYSVTAADTAGNTITTTASYRIVYGFGGFLPPVTLDRPFKKGSTIPVKFTLDNGCGAAAPTVTATLSLRLVSGAEPAGDPITASSNVPDSGNVFRYSAEDGLYIYNLATGDLAAGIYLAAITTDDGVTRTVTIQIKQ